MVYRKESEITVEETDNMSRYTLKIVNIEQIIQTMHFI